ncbi:MAG: amidohydrolase family protein [Candidatus Dormibacteria bacterium]
MPDPVQQAVWRHFDGLPRPWGIRYRGDQAERLRTLRDLGVRHHTALAYAHRPEMAAWLNDFTLDFADRVATALPTFTFYPETAAPAYVESALQRGGKVAKVHLQVGKFDPMRPDLTEVWEQLEAAEAAETAVVIHAGAVADGSAGEEWCGMAPVRNLLRRWPGLRLVLAHMGAPDYVDAVELANEFPQLWMDTAMVLVDSKSAFEYPEALLEWWRGRPTASCSGRTSRRSRTTMPPRCAASRSGGSVRTGCDGCSGRTAPQCSAPAPLLRHGLGGIRRGRWVHVALERLLASLPALASDARVRLPAALVVSLHHQGRNRGWSAVFIESDKHQVGAAGVVALSGAHLFRLDPHPNLHRGAPDVVDRGVDRHQVADVDGVQEAH